MKFLQKNAKIFLIVGICVVVVVGGIFLYLKANQTKTSQSAKQEYQLLIEKFVQENQELTEAQKKELEKAGYGSKQEEEMIDWMMKEYNKEACKKIEKDYGENILNTPSKSKTNIAYSQVMQNLSCFKMESSPLSDGRDRYLGRTEDKLAVLELIGDKNDLEQITLSLFVVNNDLKATEIGLILNLFLNNIVPNDQNIHQWTADTIVNLGRSSDNEPEEIKYYDNFKIKIKLLRSLGLYNIIVN